MAAYRDRSNDSFKGGDVAGECDAGSPGSAFAIPAPALPASVRCCSNYRFPRFITSTRCCLRPRLFPKLSVMLILALHAAKNEVTMTTLDKPTCLRIQLAST